MDKSVSVPAAVTGFVINAEIAGIAGWLFVETLRRRVRMIWLFVFLWGDLFAYPFTNVLALYGWYSPSAHLANKEMLGVALVALFRYAWLLSVIGWLRFSKSAKAYLIASPTNLSASPEPS